MIKNAREINPTFYMEAKRHLHKYSRQKQKLFSNFIKSKKKIECNLLNLVKYDKH